MPSDDLIARDLAASDAELGIFDPTEYHVYIRDAAYKRVAELQHWTALDLKLAFNDVGTWSLETSADDREANLLTKTGGIIVTRIVNGVERTIFSGFVWTEWGWTETAFRASGYSDEAMLWAPARPVPGLADPPFEQGGTPVQYDVETGVASTIMRRLVNLNIGPSAPGRWATAALGFTADPFLGATITARANLQPLLTLLAELAITPYAGGLGFRLRQSDVNPNAVDFDVYAPEDKSEDAKFSVDLGTASEYEETQSAPDANHVFVMGGDQFGANRTIISAEDTASQAEWGRVISTVIDRRGTTDPSELEQNAAEAIAGVSTLKRTAIRPFDVKSLQFGVDYDLGTLVTIVTHGGETVDLIRAVEISLDPEKGALVTPIVGQGDGSDDERMATIVRTIQDRTSNLERNWNVPPDSIDRSMLLPVVKPPIGAVEWLAHATVPTGWLLCDGASYLRTAYAALFALIGTTYGAADGTHFNVPDLRGRMILGVSGSHALASTGGAETATGPAHTHPGSHSHGTVSHTHAGGSHTHTGAAHTHPGSHTHTLGAHTHDFDHSHVVAHSHNHGGITSGPSSTTTRQTGGGLDVATDFHWHDIATNNMSVTSDSPDHDITSGPSGLDTGSSNTATAASYTGDTGSSSATTGSAAPDTQTDSNVFAASYSGSISVMPPFISLTPIIYAAA